MIKYILSVAFLITLSGKTFSQTGLWLKVGAEKKLSKNLALEVNLQPRFNQISWPPSSWLAEAGFKYDLPKDITLAVYYRFINNLKKEEYKPYHRFYGDLSYKLRKLNPIILDYRIRYQQQFKDDDAGLITDKNYWRNKLEISFKNKSKFEPAISADAFYKVGYAFDQIRYKASINYDLTKRQKIELGILFDDAINSSKTTKSRASISWKIKL